MFSFLKKLISKVIKVVLKYWFVILLLAIIFAPLLAPVLSTLAASLPAWAAWLPAAISALGAYSWVACLIVAVGMAYVVYPEETKEVIESVAVKAGEIIGSVTAAAAGGLATGLGLDEALPFIVMGVGAYFLLTNRKDKDTSDDTTVGEGDSYA